MDEIIINIEDEDQININVAEDEDTSINVDDRITIIQPVQHSDLKGLSYESSGHTGFVPARLSTLPDLDTSSDRLSVMVYVDNDGHDEKISLKDMFGLFVRRGKSVPEDMQAGEYLFLEKQ